MIRITKSLNKTEKSDVFFYTYDASEMFSFSAGQAQFQLSLPYDINKGVYYLCKRDKFFTDYLLFAVNQSNQYINCPGIYAAFSPYGINFTIWTRFGRFSLFDNTTDISANQSFIIEFCWDQSGLKLGSGATMAIFVNGLPTCSGNHLISDEDISALGLYVFDSKYIEYNMESSIQDVLLYSDFPPDKINSIENITNTRFSTDEILICGRAGSVLYIDGMNNGVTNIDRVLCFGQSPYSVSLDDITGNIYYGNFYNETYRTGSISKFDVSKSLVTNRVLDLESPKSICVVQKDSMDFPRNSYYDQSECDAVLAICGNRIIKFNSDLEQVSEMTGFSEPYCIRYWNDRTIWVSDYGSNTVKHISWNMSSLLLSVSINSPTFLSTTVKNDTYVYSLTDNAIYLIKDGIIKAYASTPSGVVGMDADNNSRRVLVALSNGKVRSYDSKLRFIAQYNVSDSISSLYIRRGYHQDCYIIIDEINSEVICARVSNPRIVISRTKYDPSIYFNGSICATAKNLDVEAQAEGEFNIRYSLDQSRVKNLSAVSYKVIRRDVDLSNGGAQGGYLDYKNITSDKDPTDPQGAVEQSSEVE